MSQSPQEVDGLLLVQQTGQSAMLIQPETGTLRQRLPPDCEGLTVPRDSQSWLQLGPEGQLRSGSKDWQQWKPLGQLRLQRGDHWLGPPVMSGSAVYVGSLLGQVQRIEFSPQWKITQLPGFAHPLLPPLAHPEGVVEVSVDGQLSLLREHSSWLRRFPGWANCYADNGEILARPSLDQQGNLYLAHRQGVISWDTAGHVRWNVKLACTTAVHWRLDECYVMDDSPALLRISPRTGEILERLPVPAGPAGNLALDKQLVAMVLGNGQVVVLNRSAKAALALGWHWRTGSRFWSRELWRQLFWGGSRDPAAVPVRLGRVPRDADGC